MYPNAKLGCLAQSGASDCESRGCWFEPSPATFFRWDLVMKKISTTILALPLIQEEQLSITRERMGIKYW